MSETTQRRLVGLHLFPDVSGLNLGVYYYTCLVSIMFATFLPQSQAFLLTEFLNIPESEQGVVSGNLNFWGEIIIIATVGFFGAVSDRIGRRIVMAFGFAVMGLGFWLYPRATDINQLLMFRLIYSAGIAAVSCMIVTVVADYVQNESRGKASGYLGIMNGLGAMVAAFVLIKLPARFVADGQTPLDAGLNTYLIVVVIAAASALISWVGLKKDYKTAQEDRASLLSILADGLRAARDPGISLAYGAAFVSRGNLAIAGTFLALWLTTYGTATLGISAADALSRAGMIIGISYMAAFVSAPIFGILTDRISRTGALMVTLVFAVIGYGGTYFVSDPFSGLMITLAVFIGMSEVGCVITSGVLIAQQSPPRVRGAVIGMFNLAGAVGILVASKVGGYLFDHWRPSGPFVLFGAVALLVLIWALLISRRIVPATEGGHQLNTPDAAPQSPGAS